MIKSWLVRHYRPIIIFAFTRWYPRVGKHSYLQSFHLFVLMENSIIENFQNLHVLAAYDLAVMDDLVHDFNLALDETARNQRSCRDGSSQSHDSLMRRRRKFKKRKANISMLIHGSNMSEASESSLDEAFKDYIENIARQSDSDEFLVNGHKIPPVHSFPNISVPQLVESDSVTENITPLRPQRRRRHFKRMAIDTQPDVEFYEQTKGGCMECRTGQLPAGGVMESGFSRAHLLSGKRKRSSKDKSDSNSFDLDVTDENQQDNRVHNLSNHNRMMDGNISSLSSDESDCGNSTGDGRDGDDEESDAYHEAEDNMLQNLTNEEMEKMRVQAIDADIQKIFAASLDLMSPTSRNCFKARMKALNGRQIQAGRRRLKDRHPAYSLSCFLQERQMWSCGWQQQGGAGTIAMMPSGTSKRHRRMPPADTSFEMMAEQSEPSAGTNINCRLLSSTAAMQPMFSLGQKTTRSKMHSSSSVAH